MKRFFLAATMACLFFSCSKDGNIGFEEPDGSIEISVFYEPEYAPSIQKPDYKAKVFVYYDVSLDEPFTFEQGKINKNRSKKVISPEQTFIIDEDGCMTLIPKYNDKEMLLIIESNYYTGKLASMSYSDQNKVYKSSFLFDSSLRDIEDYEEGPNIDLDLVEED